MFKSLPSRIKSILYYPNNNIFIPSQVGWVARAVCLLYRVQTLTQRSPVAFKQFAQILLIDVPPDPNVNSFYFISKFEYKKLLCIL